MSVGGQTSKVQIDQSLTDLAVAWRLISTKSTNLLTQLASSGDMHGTLVALGYSDSPNAANPGGVSDAAYAANLVSYMSSIAGVYFGTVQHGGTGGTGAILFNYNNALSPLWAGQV